MMMVRQETRGQFARALQRGLFRETPHQHHRAPQRVTPEVMTIPKKAALKRARELASRSWRTIIIVAVLQVLIPMGVSSMLVDSRSVRTQRNPQQTDGYMLGVVVRPRVRFRRNSPVW